MTPAALAARILDGVRSAIEGGRPYRRTHYLSAVQMPAKRKRWRRIRPWGAVVHTTGRGVVGRAAARGTTPIEEALRVYDQSAGPHYAIDQDGTVYQIQPDDRRGAHVGISAAERRSYLSGKWRTDNRIAPAGIALWDRRWGKASPQHLYPTRSPNACYIGIEMIPRTSADLDADRFWYTREQHLAIGPLLADCARRHGWPAGWHRTPRLVGHEDIDAFARWDRRGGWDPGALREEPRFDWEQVLAALDG